MNNLLQMTIYITVTALMLLLFKRLFKNKLSAKWQVYVWGILLIRLLLPSLPQSEISVFNAIPTTEYTATQPTQMVVQTEGVPAELTIPATETIAQSIPTERIIEMTWASGSAALFLYFFVIYCVFLYRAKRKPIVSDAATLKLLEECRRLVGVKRKVTIISGDSPMLLGVIKPAIILPEGYSEGEQRDIFTHELCHLKNRDIPIIWLAIVILCLNWFNPIIWYSFFLLRRDIEVYCDERVLAFSENKKEYASLLLKTALAKNRFIAGTTSLQNGEKEVERRIRYMAYFKKPKVIGSIVIAAVALLISVFCLTNSYADPKMTDDKYREYIARPIGSIMAEIDYADEEKVVFHYTDGFFVYDLQSGTFRERIDLTKLNCALHQQGSAGIYITVSADGKEALIANYGYDANGSESEIKGLNNYLINLETGRAKTTTLQELADPFTGLIETYTEVPGASGWFSNNSVLTGDRIYYLAIKERPYISDMKLIIANTDGEINRTAFPFSPDKTAYKGTNFSFVAPHPDVTVSDYPEVMTEDDRIGVAENVHIQNIESISAVNNHAESTNVTEVTGYRNRIYRIDETQTPPAASGNTEKQDLSMFFIEYPDKPDCYVVIFFRALSEADIDFMLKTFTFDISDLYAKTVLYMQEEFYRVYSPHYEILDLQVTNWQQTGNEATFRYRKNYKNYDKDPDTVDYIREARERGDKNYEIYKKEYLEPKESYYPFKILWEGDELTLYYDQAPKGTDWQPIKIDDFVASNWEESQ